jgi:hypothetical protein
MYYYTLDRFLPLFSGPMASTIPESSPATELLARFSDRAWARREAEQRKRLFASIVVPSNENRPSEKMADKHRCYLSFHGRVSSHDSKHISEDGVP